MKKFIAYEKLFKKGKQKVAHLSVNNGVIMVVRIKLLKSYATEKGACAEINAWRISMNIEIVQGNFSEAKKYCESKKIETVFFELSHIDSDEKARFEFNRFTMTVESSDVIGEEATKRVILNLSPWNEKYSYNKYLESFLYMMSDMQDKLEYKIILEKELNKELYNKMTKLKLFEFSITALPTMIKENPRTKIGFYDNCDRIGAERNV